MGVAAINKTLMMEKWVKREKILLIKHMTLFCSIYIENPHFKIEIQ